MHSMPMELHRISDATAVVGDIDAFIDYVESGEAALDYERLVQEGMERDIQSLNSLFYQSLYTADDD